MHEVAEKRMEYIEIDRSKCDTAQLHASYNTECHPAEDFIEIKSTWVARSDCLPLLQQSLRLAK